MQRKEAEKLLAALIFDDLDEASKKELLNYLQTDNELRERLADMRMAVKVASDTVQHGPDPVLGKRRLKRLARLARHHHTWTTIFTVPRMAAAAAIFIIATLALISIQPMSMVDKARVASTEAYERVPTYKLSLSADTPESAPSDSESRRIPEITSTTGQFALESGARRPEVLDRGYAYDPAVRSPKVGDKLKGMIERKQAEERKSQMEEDRKARIKELMDNAMVLQGQMRYEEALGQLESSLVLDPMNDNALIQKQTLEDMMGYRRQIEVNKKKSKEGIDVLRKTAEASIPYAQDLTYPDHWKDIIASPYRKPEEPLGQGQYAFDPAVRGPEVIDSITSVNNEKDFTKNKIGGGSDTQLFSLHGIDDFRSYADSSFKAGPTDKSDSRSMVAGSTLEGGQSSEMHEGGFYAFGGYGRGGHRADYGDKNGDGTTSYYYPAFDYGGMGGFGGMGGGEGGGGIMAPSPGSGYAGMGGYGNYDVRGREFYFHSGKDSSAEGLKAGNRGDAGSGFAGGKTLNGFISGDELVGADTYNGNIDFKGKKIRLFSRNPDDTTVVANGGEVVGGSVFFQNGQAVGTTTTDGSTVTIIDSSFDVVSNDGVPSTVTVDVGKPVTFATPTLIPPSKPTSGVTDISEVPGLKLKTDSGEPHLKAEDIKTHGWWAKMRADSYDEVLKKKNEELAARRPQLVPEPKVQPVKPPVPGSPGSSLVERGQRQGDVSREMDEAAIPYSTEISSADSKKYIADFLKSTEERDEKSASSSEGDISRFPQPTDEVKALLGTKPSADYEYSIPAEGPAGKKESGHITIVDCMFGDRGFQDQSGSADKEENGRGKVPILGDIPLIGGLYRTDGKKRPLTDEEKKRIVKYLEGRKSQPQGETAELDYETVRLNYLDPQKVEDSIGDGFRDLAGAEFLPGVAIESLPQDKQIIIFGRKEQREAVKNMIREMDIPPGESATESTSGFIGEDEPDLPPASRFKLVPVNPWVMAERDPLSTFALDVDTASYALCRRYIRGGFLPPAGAVRMEEFINYFNYHYPQRTNPTFKVHAEAAPSPFARQDQNLTLLKIGVKARTIGRDQRKASNLILVVDASASMGQPDRLPLVQQALYMLVDRLADVDRVSLITCAGEARLHLETVPARERDKIRQAIYAIQPAGPTNLLAGLKLGYATARRSFAPKQINHVVLCSDGVANVGQTEAEAVLEEVAADRKQGITITCVGVGYGSYNDVFLEALANRGDGSYVFLDSPRQAQRVFVRQLAATLQTVAKDARIQVDFNPQRVRRYRLIGYENRDIEDKRFRDDTIDAGEVGSGQCSTALYELELVGQSSADEQGDLGTVFVRYRNVETGQIEEISSRLSSAIVRRRTVESAPRFFLAAGAARFAEILRQSEHAQDGSLTDVLRIVEQVSLALGLDRDVRELADLIRKAEHLPRSP